ncbi:general secretion pathway protein GspB [Desulfobacter latus]|uniref:General secretion pathway protein GspB n=1 Tax=Desulfobacter latus TaxID=2292 RepID=A0A850T1R5_9BACT|nr:general secretion pathway protein GspB [Desulfobacter latus]NWH05653.1 general secretion pathway protein GspB [Desulfobacter latus]
MAYQGCLHRLTQIRPDHLTELKHGKKTMSTILNALKQAEKESRQHAPDLSFNSSTTTGFQISGRGKPYMLQPVLFIFIPLFVAGLCVAYFYYPFKNNMVLPVTAPETEKKAHQPLIKKEPSHLPRHAAAIQPLPSPPPPIRTKTIKTQPKPRIVTETGPKPADTDPDIPIQSQIPIMADRSLKIQAISWDHTPENRITVINNTVLHQGDVFQNLHIVKIKKTGVILNKNGSDYLLKFDYR